jgi:hypothetical protein
MLASLEALLVLRACGIGWPRKARNKRQRNQSAEDRFHGLS